MDNTKTNTMTLGNLPFGTTVLYNDQANTDLRLTIVGHEQDQFGKWVEVLTENGSIDAPDPRVCNMYKQGWKNRFSQKERWFSAKEVLNE